MIVSCPSCTTRYDLGTQHNQGPLSITCRRCGHSWKEAPIIDLEELPVSRALTVVEHDPEPELDISRLVEAAHAASAGFAERRRSRLRKIGGWTSFAACTVLPLAVLAAAPETVVQAAPLTAKAYQKLGWDVNIYGIDIRKVEQQNQDIDGQHVLLIKGEVSNPTNVVRKIPWLRFALNDDQGHELYSWTLDTTSRPLRPGETTGFTTRVSAPPELAKNLQIRFAHTDEIGSNHGS